MPIMTTLSDAEKIRQLRRHVSNTVLDEHARHADKSETCDPSDKNTDRTAHAGQPQ